MKLSDLFNHIKTFNQTFESLNCSTRYGLKFGTYKSYENLDCFNVPYTDIDTLSKAVIEETYFTDIADYEIALMEEAGDILDLEYSVTFTGKDNSGAEYRTNYNIWIVPLQ